MEDESDDQQGAAGELPPNFMQLFAVRDNVCFGHREITESLELFEWTPVAGIVPESWRAYIDCSISANNCYEFFECKGLDPDLEPCRPEEFEPRCSGNAEVWCSRLPNGEYYRAQRECDAQPFGLSNTHCTVEDDPSEGLVTNCRGEPCDEPSEQHCEGDKIVACTDGERYEIDCAAYGKTCDPEEIIDESESLVCALSDRPCVGSESFCRGDILYDCYDGALETGLNCAQLFPGTTCIPLSTDPEAEGEDRYGCGIESGDNNGYWTESCIGDVVNICVGEQCARFDCSSFLSATCVFDEDDKHATCVSEQWAISDQR